MKFDPLNYFHLEMQTDDPSWIRSIDPQMSDWEAAYCVFETAQEEEEKFLKRLRSFGVEGWNANLQVVEIFCGRGNGLRAWRKLGFPNLEGFDLSPSLIEKCPEGIPCAVCDCRWLPLEDASRDVIIVQGGLHHLKNCSEELESVFKEVVRVLRPTGKFLVVEPWRTPYLDWIHLLSTFPVVRRCSCKFKSFATMVRHEIDTYHQWLSSAERIEEMWNRYFVSEVNIKSKGQWRTVGVKKAVGESID